MIKLQLIKEVVQETLSERAKLHLHIKKGAFHKWLGKSEDEPITAADIKKGLAAGGHAAKMANFARNFGHVHESIINEVKEHKYTSMWLHHASGSRSSGLGRTSTNYVHIMGKTEEGKVRKVKHAVEHHKAKELLAQHAEKHGLTATHFPHHSDLNGTHYEKQSKKGEIKTSAVENMKQNSGEKIKIQEILKNTSDLFVENYEEWKKKIHATHGHEGVTFKKRVMPGGSEITTAHKKGHQNAPHVPYKDAVGVYQHNHNKGEVLPEEVMNEVLKNASASEYIDDFVHSKNKKFSGDSKKQRIRRALGAYYGNKK